MANLRNEITEAIGITYPNIIPYIEYRLLDSTKERILLMLSAHGGCGNTKGSMPGGFNPLGKTGKRCD